VRASCGTTLFRELTMANKINLGIVIAENLAHQNLQSRTRCCGSYYFHGQQD
jgi:hypothetical protein